MTNEERFKHIWDYLARRGVGKDVISKFNIGYAPPYSDEQHQGRALIDGFLPRFEKDNETFKAFTGAGFTALKRQRRISGSTGRSYWWVYYLGGPAKDQAPFDMLKPVVDAISGFSLGTSDDRCAMGPETIGGKNG